MKKLLFFAIIFLSSCSDEPQTRPEYLKDRSFNCIYLIHEDVKQRIKYPLTAKFDMDIDFNIEDTIAGTTSIYGKGQCTNAFGVPVEFTYTALIHIDSTHNTITHLSVH